jgi:hypothetical protein
MIEALLWGVGKIKQGGIKSFQHLFLLKFGEFFAQN